MVAPVNGFNWGNIYEYNNGVKVPYRPEEKKNDDVVIPYRPADETTNIDEVRIKKHHGASAEVAYSTTESLSAEVQPYKYTVEKDDSEHMSVSVGPYVKVSGITSEYNKVPTNMNQDKTIQLGAGIKVDGEVSKELPTVDNTEIYAGTSVQMGYGAEIPSINGKTDIKIEDNPRSDLFTYNVGLKAGLQYNINDKSNTRFYGGLDFLGNVGTKTFGNKKDAGVYNVYGVSQYRKEPVNKYVFIPKIGGEYNVTTSKGLKISLGGEVGCGLDNYNVLPYGKAGVKLGF